MKNFSFSSNSDKVFPRPALFADGRDIIWVMGKDAAAYLQGQLTQDVLKLKPGMSKQAFILEPKGYVDALLSVKKITDKCFLLGTERGFGSLVAERLKRFKVRVKVDLIEDQALRLSLFSFGDSRHLENLSLFYREYLNDYVLQLSNGQSVYENSPPGDLTDSDMDQNMLWGDLAVYEVLIPGKGKADFFTDTGDKKIRRIYELLSGAGNLDLNTFEFLRICCAIPRMGYEITGKVLPSSLGINHIAVDYDKGCYTGQELVARLEARGDNVPFLLKAILLDHLPTDPADNDFLSELATGGNSDEIKSGEQVHQVFLEGKNVGKLTSYAEITGVKLRPALAFIKRGAEPGTHIEIMGAKNISSHSEEKADHRLGEGEVVDIPIINALEAFGEAVRTDSVSLS